MTTHALDTYRLLGRSGLRVSPLALGTMTFGEAWGADEIESRRMFDAYVDRGGNFIDTAGYYARGRSEALTGTFAAGKRDGLVLSTKYSLSHDQGNPNAGGNGRKSMMASVERSLRALDTDYIDLLFLHAWDDMTPPDEILRGLDDLVRQGKVLYLGISDTPAWQIARLQTIADLRGWTQLVALQIEYNLLQRAGERELIPAAEALGLGVTPWSPLASGRLSGKYASGAVASEDPEGGRKAGLMAHNMVGAETLRVADLVQALAGETGFTSAQIALAWIMAKPAVVAPIVGARTLRQLEDNLGALAVPLEPEHVSALDAGTAIELGFPHEFLQMPFIKAALTGGTTVRPRG